ncbi:hypothetical protein [Algisphaera agarilytica]|uniref:Uncharacterized protein n=1 Tax=Algisphaera agarilytica TaxID=1385975 RepID=A0A7X0H7U0_9BACT|nr:hypothetical protein [Algisphaera agarilytica]MBB6430708.1 hypothetical protein [Algisphaera agarilytica]
MFESHTNEQEEQNRRLIVLYRLLGVHRFAELGVAGVVVDKKCGA